MKCGLKTAMTEEAEEILYEQAACVVLMREKKQKSKVSSQLIISHTVFMSMP